MRLNDGTRSALVVLAFVVLGALGLELLLRQPAVEAALPIPERYLWHADNVQAKLDGLTRLAAERGVDLLFLGNSTVLSGIDPARFDAARGRDSGPAAYNGALEGMPASGALRFAEVYARQVRPDTLIYGLTPQDLNPNSPTGRDVADRIRHSAMVAGAIRDDAYGQLIHWLMTNSALFRYRPVLHALVVGGGQLTPLQRIYFDDRGWVADNTRLSDVAPADRRRFANKDGVMEYTTAGTESQALADLITTARQLGLRLILVNMPVSDDYYQNFDDPADYGRYVNTVRALADAGGVPFWDMEALPAAEAFGDADFADFIHLNRSGAGRLAAILAERWRALAARPR